jgi:hypothetical protein
MFTPSGLSWPGLSMLFPACTSLMLMSLDPARRIILRIGMASS